MLSGKDFYTNRCNDHALVCGYDLRLCLCSVLEDLHPTTVRWHQQVRRYFHCPHRFLPRDCNLQLLQHELSLCWS